MHSDLQGSEIVSPSGTPAPPLPDADLLPLGERFRRSITRGPSFRNPILPSPSANPWVIQHEGHYYHCESRNQDSIWIRRSPSLPRLGEDPGAMVWSAPALGANSKSVWAPELHRIGGRWFLYYAADDGHNENHRIWVLEGPTGDPRGPYRCRGALDTAGWAIDGTVLRSASGPNYFVWSGWPGRENGLQNIYVERMASPWAVTGGRVAIATPTEAWERVDMPVCEAPQILRRGRRTFLVYSASGSWTPDYCLGLMELTGRDPLNPAHWEKHGCAFSKTDLVWGVGHCSFARSPDGTEDWIVYHAKSKRTKGWSDRNVRAQRFTWTSQGLPNFGAPIPAGVPVPVPSGDALEKTEG